MSNRPLPVEVFRLNQSLDYYLYFYSREFVNKNYFLSEFAVRDPRLFKKVIEVLDGNDEVVSSLTDLSSEIQGTPAINLTLAAIRMAVILRKLHNVSSIIYYPLSPSNKPLLREQIAIFTAEPTVAFPLRRADSCSKLSGLLKTWNDSESNVVPSRRNSFLSFFIE